MESYRVVLGLTAAKYAKIYCRNLISCKAALLRLFRKKRYTNNLELNWIELNWIELKVDKNGLTIHRENVLNSLMLKNRAQEITERHFH